MYFNTQRCIVREFELSDIPKFMEYRNHSTWMKYQGFKNQTETSYQQELLKKAGFESGKNLAVIHKKNRCLLGDIYVKKVADSYWIGYTIHYQEARKGYGFEVVTGLIHWLFICEATKIMASVVPENLASIRILEKLGFNYVRHEEGEDIFCLTESSL